MAKVVGTVHKKISIVLLCDFLVVDEVWRVRGHGEQSFCYNQDGVVRVLLASLFDHLLHFVLVEMLELLQVLGG